MEIKDIQPAVYKIYKDGPRTWFVGICANNGDHIYMHNPKDERGYGGREFTFQTDTDGIHTVKGPWHCTPEDLIETIGLDLRTRILTWGAIGEEMDDITDGATNTIHKDKVPILGPYDRIKKKAQDIANKRQTKVYYITKSVGCSTYSTTYPKKGK